MKELSEQERVKKDRELFSKLETFRKEEAEDDWEFGIEYVSPFLNKFGDEDWDDRRYDVTATESSEMLADGQFGNMMSPHSDWVSYKAEDDELNDDPDFAEYLKKRKKDLYSELQRSNFYDVMPEFLKTGNTIATAPIFIDDDPENGSAALSLLHPWEVYITQNRFGRVNRVFRKFQLTAEQASEAFEDEDKYSENLKRDVEENPQTLHWFIQVIEKRPDRDETKLDDLNMPISCRYLEMAKSNMYIKEAGYRTWPIPVWRWSLKPNNPYGYGPTHMAKPLILTANQIQRDLLRANHKAIDMPVQAHRNLRGRIDMDPGGVTYLENMGERIEGTPAIGALAAGQAELDWYQERIKQAYKTQHFLMLLGDDDKGDKTALEIRERKNEKTSVIGSTIGKFMSEALIPILERIDQIGIDAGRIEDVPEDILARHPEYAGKRIKFEFRGQLAQAQKQLVETQGMMIAMELSTMVMQIAPETRHNVDWNEVLREIWETYDAAGNLLDMKDVEKIIAGEKQQQQQQMQLAMAEQASKAVPNMSKAPEPGSPMEKMSG